MRLLRFFPKLTAAVSLVLCLGLAPGSYGIPSFDSSTAWVNGDPLGSRSLEGKVVLVDFFEYTCVNCLRTLPYLRAWYARYHDDGLVIVGVQSPEFDFSGEQQNVEAAARRLQISWPLVLDDDFAIWSRFNNDAWPTEYLFDQDGKLVDVVSGEGQYPQTEAKIQAMLKAQNPKLVLPPPMALLPQDDYLKPGAMCYLHTPEVQAGSDVIGDNVASGATPGTYVDPGPPRKDGAMYLDGAWQVTNYHSVKAGLPDHAVVASAMPDRLTMRYHAIQVDTVLQNPHGVPIRVDVSQDGAPIAKTDAGSDLQYDADGTSYVTVDAPRAYEIVMNAKMAFHNLVLTPKAPGLAIYSFAFESCEVPA